MTLKNSWLNLPFTESHVIPTEENKESQTMVSFEINNQLLKRQKSSLFHCVSVMPVVSVNTTPSSTPPADKKVFYGNASSQQVTLDRCVVTGYLAGCVAALHQDPVLVLASPAVGKVD